MLPVASSSLSNAVKLPSSPVTVMVHRVDIDDANAEPQTDIVLLIPIEPIERDLVARLSRRPALKRAECGCS